MKTTETNKKSTAKIFFGFLKGSRLTFFAAAIMLMGGVAMSYIIPQVTGLTVDSLLGDEPPAKFLQPIINLFGGIEAFKQNFVFVAILVVSFTFIQMTFVYFRRVFANRTAERVGKNIRDTMYEHIQHLPFSWHQTMQTGDIIQRSTQDSDLVKRFVSNQLLELVRMITMLVMGVTLMFLMNVTMAFVALGFIPLVLMFSLIVAPKIHKRFKLTEEAEGRLTAKLQENLSGVRVVRAFGRQREELDSYTKMNQEYTTLWTRLGKLFATFWASGDFFSAVQTLTILTVGAILTIKDPTFTIGTLLIFVSYNNMLVWPARNIGRLLAEAVKVRIGLRRLNEVLTAETDISSPDEIFPQIEGEIAFKNVSFSYDGTRNVLEDISFTIPKGKVFGIMGGTGGGKSTVAQLINRLYEPTEGQILLDGIDIKTINRAHIRKNVGLILQEPFLFSKSVQENLVLAKPDYTQEELDKYISVASLDSTMQELQDGLQTIVGEKGVTLSGGQKQRIVIARTLIQHPKVVIFDDSLSAVDTETDYKIRQALTQNFGDTTLIIITHRITSVMHADNILILNNGRVEDIGTHEQLIAREGTYKRLYDLQTKMEEDEQDFVQQGDNV